MQAAITISYAVADFSDLRERGFYYVDKTQYISLLERYNALVFLRPRRFGKSLLVSTLTHYYDINKVDKFDSLFGGIYIGNHPTPERNKYMVLRFDFSKLVLADNMAGLERNFNNLLCPIIQDSVEERARYPRFFEGFRFKDTDNAAVMLQDIQN